MKEKHISKRVTAILVYGRPPLVFGGMVCALFVMWTQNPILYILGVLFLFVSMTFDLVDGWFAARFSPHPVLAHLADRVMDRIVYSIIFPLVSVGMMWRLLVLKPDFTKTELLHAIFILILCVTVMIRDSFANFLRVFTMGKGPEPEPSEYTRLRTVVAAPVGALLYAHAFYVPEGPQSHIYLWLSWLGNLPLRGLFLIEIIFLIINFGSIARYSKKYGATMLKEVCLEDERLRRRILSFFPNALTVMNAIMGLLAVFFAYQSRIREAYLFLIGAAMFDKLDGALARKLGLTEPLPGEPDAPRVTLGGIMDDISDAISFCIVPAWLFYITYSSVSDPVIQKIPIALVSLIYASMGIMRLIYFTLDTSPIPGFFKGIPTPAAALLVSSPMIIFHQVVNESLVWARFWGIFNAGLFIFASILMNSYPIHYLHFGKFMDKHPWYGRISLLTVLIFVFTPWFGHITLAYMIVYVLSPIYTRKMEPNSKTA